MKLTYDPRYNIAYIRFQSNCSGVEPVKVGDELILDMAPDGTVYGIELLNANELLKCADCGKLLVANEATGEETEVPLSIL